MEARQQDFSTCVNLLMPSKVWYLHHIQDSVPHDVHSPQMGDDLRHLPLGPGSVLLLGENSMVLVISQVEVTDIQRHDFS
jgi:hypothetical protein